MAGRCSPCVGSGVDYEIRCLMHCILSRGTGIECCWVPSHCGLHWNEISGRLTKQGAIKKKVSQIPHNNRLLLFREISSRPEKTVHKEFEK